MESNSGLTHEGCGIVKDRATPSGTSIESVFARSPLGLVEIDREGRLVYANAKALDVCGLDSWMGKSLRDLFPDDERYSVIQDKLSARMKGLSEEYEIELTRVKDGKRVPISVAAMPIVSGEGQVLGGYAIVRSLEVDRVIKSINEIIHGSSDWLDLIRSVATQIQKVIPFDSLTVSMFSRDMNDARVILEFPEHFLALPQRWFTITAALRDFAFESKRSRRCLQDFYQSTGDRSLKSLIERGFQWMMRCPAFSEGRLIGSLSLFTRNSEGFSDRQFEIFDCLPIDTALQAALHIQTMQDLEFRFNLIKEISSCQTEAELFELLVNRISEHYRWSHVSLFVVDDIESRFVLQSQSGYSQSRLEMPCALPVSHGVLGYVYQTGKDVRIADLKNDAVFKDIAIDLGIHSSSELCLKIASENRIYALFNVEDVRTSAFSASEEQILREILDELGAFISKRRDEIEVSASFERTPTAVFFVDNNGMIRRINPAAVSLLECRSSSDLIGTSIADWCDDPTVGVALVRSPNPRGKVELRTREGVRRRVVVGGSPIDASVNRRMITFRDTSIQKKADELDALATVFADIAQEVKTPLAIISGCVGELRQLSNASIVETVMRQSRERLHTTVTRIVPQLHRLEITYDRLIRNIENNPFSNPVRLKIKDVVREFVDEFPETEATKISFHCDTARKYLYADPQDTRFMIQTLLAYLLRYAGTAAKIDLTVKDHGPMLRISISGPFVDFGDREAAQAGESARFLDGLAFGKAAIVKVVQRHSGVFHEPVIAAGRLEFCVDLPQTED